jgi:hypothetical protein
MNINSIDYRSKYLKYKAKYLLLKELEGGVVSDEEESKIPKEIARAASGINVMELLLLKPFLEELDDLAQANKQEAKKEFIKAKKAVAATANAKDKTELALINLTDKNVKEADTAVRAAIQVVKQKDPNFIKKNQVRQEKAKAARESKEEAGTKLRTEREARRQAKQDSNEDFETKIDLFSDNAFDSSVDDDRIDGQGTVNRQAVPTKRGTDPKSLPPRNTVMNKKTN